MFIVYHIIDPLITLQVFSVDEVLRCQIVHTWNKGTKVHETLPKVQTKAAYLMIHKQEQTLWCFRGQRCLYIMHVSFTKLGIIRNTKWAHASHLPWFYCQWLCKEIQRKFEKNTENGTPNYSDPNTCYIKELFCQRWSNFIMPREIQDIQEKTKDWPSILIMHIATILISGKIWNCSRPPKRTPKSAWIHNKKCLNLNI